MLWAMMKRKRHEGHTRDSKTSRNRAQPGESECPAGSAQPNSAATGTGTWRSWNGNIVHRYHTLFGPRTEEELVQAVGHGARHNQRVRAFGSRQSSADIAAGAETLIDMTSYTGIVSEDRERMQITVRSGTRLSRLLPELEARGWCLPCLPDIDTVTLGGALATGSHGTAGDGHILSEYMVACRLVTAEAGLREIDAEHEPELMAALRCSLGLLGLFSTITLQAHPLYYLRVTERPARDQSWLARYRELLAQHDFVRLLWLPHTGYGSLITGDRIESAGTAREAPATESVREKPPPRYYRHRREVSKRLYRHTARRPGFTRYANRILRALFFSHRVVTRGTLYGATVTKSRGSPLELAEWSVAIDRFDELFRELRARLDSRANDAYAHIPMDVRFLEPDQTWLSQAYDRYTVTMGCVTRNPEHADSYAAFDLVERVFLAYDGRPHWAKRFRADHEALRRLWPRFDDFVAVRRRMDPNGRFLNGYLATLFE